MGILDTLFGFMLPEVVVTAKKIDYSGVMVILDNGHGLETLGKRSPDGRLREYAYAREIVKRIAIELEKIGIAYTILTPEDNDVSLITRVARANKIAEKNKLCFLISVHNDAAGGGTTWCKASGWTGWVYTGASSKSKKLAQLLYDEAENQKLQGNRSVPKERYWTANYYILKHTTMPAVLTENLFQDNKKDVDLLLSEEGKQKIVQLHVDGIKKFIRYLKGENV